MKKLKLTIAIIVLTFLMCGSILGQVWHVNVIVSFDEYDYTPVAPYLGIVSGTFTYRYAIKLTEAGKIESVHWMVQDCNLHNQDGEKVLFVDNGHDNLGIIWDFLNRPDFYNGYDPKLQYSSDEGWLDSYMPALLPVEGTFVDMSFKMMVKGKKWDVYAAMVQIHMNANGVITANVTKP